jgi:hypothetical protein
MILRNERGIITVDFMFSMVMILGLASLMFVLTFTLSVASVTQYITFAAARNYVVGHIDPATQEQRAQAKYQELVNHKVFKPLYTNGWYKVDPQPAVGDHTKIIPGYGGATQGTNKFWGVGTNFTAAVLEFKIPGFGSTQPDGDGSGEGFKTYMGSYLGREPTTEECINFVNVRWNAIRNLQVSGGAAYSTGTASSGYFPMTDDGC